jgi:hypothetical protein
MQEEEKSRDLDGPQAIDPDVKEVMDDHTRLVSGRGPNVTNEARKERVLVKEAWRAVEARDERAFSEKLRRAGVKDGSPEWKKAWEIYRSACGQP